MPIFLVTPLGHNSDRLGDAVRRQFQPGDCFEIQARAGWLLSFPGTTIEVSNLLGLTGDSMGDPPLGSAMVTTIGSYYGRGPATMWEWLKTRMEMQR